MDSAPWIPPGPLRRAPGPHPWFLALSGRHFNILLQAPHPLATPLNVRGTMNATKLYLHFGYWFQGIQGLLDIAYKLQNISFSVFLFVCLFVFLFFFFFLVFVLFLFVCLFLFFVSCFLFVFVFVYWFFVLFFCYVLLCNHEYFYCLNHRQTRQTKDYIRSCKRN